MSNTQFRLLSEIVEAEIDRLDPAAQATAPAPARKGESGQPGEVPLSVRLDFAVLLTEEERSALRPPQSPFGTPPDLPPLLYAVWRIRTDVRRSYDLSTPAGYAGLLVWAIRDGRREIDALRAALAECRPALVGPVELPSGARIPVTFPWTAAVLWLDRADLQSTYPLSTAQSIQDLLTWFVRHGVFELRCGDLLPDDHVPLMCAVDRNDPSLPLTRYIQFIYEARADLRQAFNLAEFEGRRALLKWFFENGIQEYPTHPAILEHQEKVLHAWHQAQRQAAQPA